MKRKRKILAGLFVSVGAAGWFATQSHASLPPLVPADPSEPTPLQAVLMQRAEQLDERQALVEEAISECMASAGFTYVPLIPEVSVGREGDRVETDTSRQAPGPAGQGEEEARGGTNDERRATADPNEAIRARLSAEELAAYSEALWGSPDEGVLVGDITTFPGSCITRADEKLNGAQAQRIEVREDLEVLISSLNLAVRQDPRLNESETRWVQCMEARGHQVEDYFTTAQSVASSPSSGAGQGFEQNNRECVSESDLKANLAAIRYAHEDQFVRIHADLITAFLGEDS